MARMSTRKIMSDAMRRQVELVAIGTRIPDDFVIEAAKIAAKSPPNAAANTTHVDIPGLARYKACATCHYNCEVARLTQCSKCQTEGCPRCCPYTNSLCPLCDPHNAHRLYRCESCPPNRGYRMKELVVCADCRCYYCASHIDCASKMCLNCSQSKLAKEMSYSVSMCQG
jgi:hypothetical protein